MLPYNWILEAQKRLDRYIHKTPLTYDPDLDIYIKWENHQLTGSFKIRGALNKVQTLQPWELGRGIVTASAGNHGQGVALAGKIVNAPVIVFVSEHVVPTKLESMRELGADVRLVPGGYGDAEEAGLEHATSSEMTWISAYDDGQVTGGGGLTSGIGTAIKEYPGSDQRPTLIAVQSDTSAFMYSSYHHGTQDGVIELPTLADGLSGPVAKNAITIPLIRKLVDDFILVSEAEITMAIRYAWLVYQETIEGSAATSLAAVLTNKIKSRPAAIVISGGNIQPELHQDIVEGASWNQ
jgi:threonine dehydratase